MSESAAKEILSDQIPAIVDWCDRYMHQEPVEGKGNIDFKRFAMIKLYYCDYGNTLYIVQFNNRIIIIIMCMHDIL